MERQDRSSADERASERSVSAQTGAGGSAEWERVERTPAFGTLVRGKKAFLIPVVVFFTIFFLGWPTLGGFTTVLDGQAVGAVTWAYVYGFAQLATTLILLHMYMMQAAKWDRLAEKAREEAPEERTTA